MRNCTVFFIALTWITLSAGFSLSASAPSVKVGAQVLHESDYAAVSGKRIGLVSNHTALVGEERTVDLMFSSGKLQLAALFAPEHGTAGLQEDGEKIGTVRDRLTGVTVHSLYGAHKKPTREMMHGLDALLFDIQDIGARFYTYISTMGLAMQAAAEQGIPFVVLDRPNPLGGLYFGGPVLEEAFLSFTGRYPIPVAHGMTVGELALMIKGERMLPGLEQLDLRVVRMAGWQRGMQWPETGLKWIRTSPNIPDFETALLYPGICLLEGTAASVGRGTVEPFKIVGLPGLTAVNLVAALNSSNLPGVRFESAAFAPRSIPGMSSNPKYRGREVAGIRIIITEAHLFRPLETGVTLLDVLYRSQDKIGRDSFFYLPGFDHLAGTKSLRLAVTRGTPPNEIIAAWNEKLDRFAERRERYLLY